MSRDVIMVGSTMRIPLLYRSEYPQWRERFMNYLKEQTDGEAMINSIQNGDQPLPVITQVSLARNAHNAPPTLKDPKFWSAEEKKTRKIDRLARSLLIQGLPNDIYSLIDSNETAKDLWDALERRLRGSEYGEQDRNAAILYEYETFKATEGEQLLDTYLQWKQYGTPMRQTKNLMDINIDALYNILKQNQGDVNDALGYKKKAVVITSDPLALVAEKTKVNKRKEKVVVSSDYKGSGANDFNELKKITALLAKAFNQRKFYSKQTKNNLRTSSTSQSANKKQEFVKSDNKKEDKKADEKKRDMGKVKTKLGESTSDSDQEINANMVFMAQIEKVLSESDESYSFAEETIAEVIGLGYTLMFFIHSNEALEIEKFKRARENKIEFAYDYGNLNASYVNEKINFSNDYFQEIINPNFKKIDSLFQQTSSLKPYVPTVILEKIIIDLEDEVVRLLEKEKANLKKIESSKSKGFKSSENSISDSKNQSENDCHVVEKECDQVKSSKVIAPDLDTFSSVRRPKHSSVIWKKKGSSNTSHVDLSFVSLSKLNKNVKRYSCKDLLSCGNVEDKILVPKSPKNCARCAKCGHPVNGSYCQGCALLREKLEEDLVTYFQNFQNTSESSDDSTNVVNAPREPIVFKQDHAVNPPHIDRCCCECGNGLDGIYCQQCICKSCGKGFDQTQPLQFPVIHSPPQESSIEILHDQENVINSVQTFLRKFNRYSFFETLKVLLLAWDRIFKIKDALGTKQYKPEDLQELFRELSNDMQNIHEELAEYINTPGWNRHAFYDDEDDDDDVDYTIKITPVLSTEKPIDSLSMRDEHLDTIPATRSDKVIKSSVEDLVPIPSESEGIPEHMCNVPFHDNYPPLDVSKDQFEDFSESNDEFSSTDNDSFSIDNIDFVEASPLDSELVSSEVMEIVILELGGIDDNIILTIKDDILREKLLNVHFLIANIEALKDNPTPSSEFLTKSSSTSPKSFLEETNTFHNFLPKFENFYFNLGEISSGSTTIHSDISLPDYECPPTDRSDFTDEEFADELAHIISPPEYDCFYFRNLPDPGELISIFNSRIRENPSATTRVNLPVEDDHSPLLAYVV
nr:hypothetical protein [Tanacetum cinerariifolium]